jgi:DNA-directed RNA polymerase subunit RPC12/RpoP
MPQKIVCRECGEVLYESYELKPPEEIIEQLGGTCPRCGKKLKFNPNDILVQIVKKEEPRR